MMKLDLDACLAAKESDVNYVVEGAVDKRKRTVVCTKWLTGLCQKDEKCEFLHMFDLSRMPACPSFTKQRLCQNSGCVFKHADSQKKRPCQQYAFGYCRNGRNCYLAHEKLAADSLPNYVPDLYFKDLHYMFYPREPVSETDFLLLVNNEQPPLTGFARYFLMRSPLQSRVLDSMRHSLWCTEKKNHPVLIEALHQCEHVILFFACEETGHFYGAAKMKGSPEADKQPGLFGPDALAKYGHNFEVQWLRKCQLEFAHTGEVRNAFAGKTAVRFNADCQDIEEKAAIKLFLLMKEAPEFRLKDERRRRKHHRHSSSDSGPYKRSK